MEGRFQGAVCARKKLVNGPGLKIINTTNDILDGQAVYAQKFFDGHFALEAFGTTPVVMSCSRAGDASPKIPFSSLCVALRSICSVENFNTAGELSCRFSFASIGVEASPPPKYVARRARSQSDKDQKS
jgi:hypothetical protein